MSGRVLLLGFGLSKSRTSLSYSTLSLWIAEITFLCCTGAASGIYRIGYY